MGGRRPGQLLQLGTWQKHNLPGLKWATTAAVSEWNENCSKLNWYRQRLPTTAATTTTTAVLTVDEHNVVASDPGKTQIPVTISNSPALNNIMSVASSGVGSGVPGADKVTKPWPLIMVVGRGSSMQVSAQASARTCRFASSQLCKWPNKFLVESKERCAEETKRVFFKSCIMTSWGCVWGSVN